MTTAPVIDVIKIINDLPTTTFDIRPVHLTLRVHKHLKTSKTTMTSCQHVVAEWAIEDFFDGVDLERSMSLWNLGLNKNIKVQLHLKPGEESHRNYSSLAVKVGVPADWEVLEITAGAYLGISKLDIGEKMLIKPPKSDSWICEDFLGLEYLEYVMYDCSEINEDPDFRVVISVCIVMVSSRQLDNIDSNRVMLRRMFEEPLWSDFQVRVAGGEVFKVHKAVLATRSQYFSKMFESGMKEVQEGVMEIEDFNAATVQAMLEHIYTGKCTADPELVWDLILIADKYQLEQLKKQCEELIQHQVKEENVCRLLILSNDVSSLVLRKAAVDQMVSTGPAIIEFEQWKDLKDTDPPLAFDVLEDLFRTKSQ